MYGLPAKKVAVVETWMLVEVRLQNPGEGPGGPRPPLYLDQNEVRRTEKIFLRPGPPPYLRVWMTAPPPPPPLSEGLDLPLDCNQFALKKERERAHASQIL